MTRRTMPDELAAIRDELVRLCRSHRVRQLAVFGSARRGDFDPAHSDLDFLVSFEPLPPQDYAEAYFGLLEGLEALFGRPVDLVTEPSLRNPWLRREVERTRSVLYAA